ncbi:hypothetical protein F5Y09DRAFT_325411 [Xylaria sp. FL1042]|nr:hypothetical protein F5Y09DRAFT_325411 [Xylaria sp. FL1042]
MPDASDRRPSLNLKPTEAGGLMHTLAPFESSQDHVQHDTNPNQDDIFSIDSIDNEVTEKEPTPRIHPAPHPNIYQKDETHKPFYERFWGPWGWEIIAFLVAFSWSVATVVVLAKYNGEVQPSWPYNITLSAFLALSATIVRTLLLIILEEVIGHSRWSWFQVPRPLYHFEIIDQASRGPWGSLYYLARVHSSVLHPSTIATVVLLLSLGISTFTQQAIRSVTCVKPDSTTEAWVRTAQIIYDKDNIIMPPNIDIPATQALFQGPDTNNKQSSFYCPSGNCTFAATDGISYSSLGVCSKCVDVSSEMGYVVKDHIPDGADEADLPGQVSSPNKDIYCQWPKRNRTSEARLGPDTRVGAFQCNTSSSTITPQSCEIELSYSSANFTSYWTMDATEDDWDSQVAQDPTFATRFGMVTATLSGIGMEAGVPHIGKACNIPGQSTDESAALQNKSSQFYSVCWLYPCIKHYSGLVSNGKLQEIIIKTELLPLQTDEATQESGFDSYAYGSYIDPCYINGMRVDHSQMPPAFTGDNYSPNNSETVDLDCWYGFTGSIPLHFSRPLPSNWINGIPLALGQYWTIYLLSMPWYSNPDLMDPLGTISTGVENIATTMTNALREIGNNTHGGIGKAYGTVLYATVCTEINWPWFSFPAAIILATLYILVRTLVDSVHDQSPVRTWKSSVLPLLYYGLEKEDQKGGLETEHDLSRGAKKMKVCLRRDRKGDWGLENDSPEPPSVP